MNTFTAQVLQQDFTVEGGDLLIGGVASAELVRRYGSPLYVYSLDLVDRDLHRLRGAFPPGVDLHYSVKANPLMALLRFLANRGCGAEVASAGELLAALACDIPPSRILFAGPAKSREEHLLALQHGIRALHLESAAEARRVSDLCGRGRAAVGIRVNPSFRIAGAGMRMGGGSQPFGVDEEELFPLVDSILADANLDLRGLHAYVGTQLGSAPALASAYAHLLELSSGVAERLGRPLDYLDLGGGFAVPLGDAEEEVDLEDLGRRLDPLWEAHCNRSAVNLVIEPGRYLSARAGVYLCKVVDVKESRGRRILICDGGMNHNALASGTMGQVFRRNLPVVAAQAVEGPTRPGTWIAGPLCTPLDETGRDLALPAVEPGEILAFLRCGAYGMTAAHPAFLSRATPAEVVVTAGQSWLARRAGTAEQWLQGQLIPKILQGDET